MVNMLPLCGEVGPEAKHSLQTRQWQPTRIAPKHSGSVTVKTVILAGLIQKQAKFLVCPYLTLRQFLCESCTTRKFDVFVSVVAESPGSDPCHAARRRGTAWPEDHAAAQRLANERLRR